METDFFLSWQFGMTLVAALAIGIWQFLRVRRSRERRGEMEPGHTPAQERAARSEGVGMPPPR